MVRNAGTLSDAGQPQIDDARFAQAEQNADAVNDQGDGQNPNRAEDQEQFRRNDRVDHEIAIRDPCEHLRAGQGGEQRGALKVVQDLTPEAGRGPNAGDDADSAKKDETTQNDHGAVAPVHAAVEHHQADAGHRDDGDDGGYGAQKRALQPLYGLDNGAGALGVCQYRLGMSDGWSDHSQTCGQPSPERSENGLHSAIPHAIRNHSRSECGRRQGISSTCGRRGEFVTIVLLVSQKFHQRLRMVPYRLA